MYDGNLGFTSGYPVNNFYKTTNSGINWTGVASNDFVDIYFLDSLIGWKSKGDMEKSTDGGNTWINQPLPNSPNFLVTSMENFSNINFDTIWGGGGVFQIGGTLRGVLYRTTNSGENWVFQIPDTSYQINQYNFVNFISKYSGWAYQRNMNGIYTFNGGDTTFYTGIQQSIGVIPEDFILKQNYPNPFNPRTVIPFSLKRNAFVKLIVYDVKGAEVQLLAEGNYNAGEYEVDFMGKFSSSGVYFYRIFITQNNSNEVYTETKRMILLK